MNKNSRRMKVMKIINTITFKDSWRNKFSDDGQKEFKTAGGDVS